MDVTVTGRHITITDSTREQVTSRVVAAIQKLKDRVIRTEVEFSANEAKSSRGQGVTCEITVRGKGPVVRAEGSADDKMIAFDAALEKLKIQLRKAADRRKHHKGLRSLSGQIEIPQPPVAASEEDDAPSQQIAGLEVTGDGPLVVREKQFTATPLSLAQALDEMELVGHDFFLYVDAETHTPSVVYRRHGYDYGVIHLNVQPS